MNNNILSWYNKGTYNKVIEQIIFWTKNKIFNKITEQTKSFILIFVIMFYTY